MNQRPSLEGYLIRLRALSSAEGREVAELNRVPDWQRSGDWRMFIPSFGDADAQMGYSEIGAQDHDRTVAALKAAKEGIGRGAVEAARREARRALDAAAPTWRGRALHRPLRFVTWAAAATAVGSSVWTAVKGDLNRPLDVPFAIVFILPVAISIGAWLVTYLLPPSARDLRMVAERAAIGYAAASALSIGQFGQLTGGWEAVLEGRWRRGPRPYMAWGCLALGVAFVVVAFLIVPPLHEAMVGPP